MVCKFSDFKPFALKEGHLNMGETNLNGDRIDVNNIYFTKNGKPFLPVMAEIHYARLRRDEWEDRIIKMKASGVTVVSSYLFWIKHEMIEGELDFTGDNDIRYLVSLCQKHGLYCSLRIGPWITAECRNGGLPEWLALRGIGLRQNDEEYLFYVRRWYQAVYDQVKDYLFKNGGNIILIQFDNELTHRPEHMQKLKDMALEIGLTAPIYTATGWNLAGGALIPQTEMIPTWGGYVAQPWTRHTDPIDYGAMFQFRPGRTTGDIGTDQIEMDKPPVNLPDDISPYVFAELGTGITTSKHRRPFVKDYDTYSWCLTRMGCGSICTGYYLYSGGRNFIKNGMSLNWTNDVDFNKTVYPLIAYDFQAPISSHGNLKDSYRYLKLLNLLFNNYGEELATLQTRFQKDKVEGSDPTVLRYCTRTDGERNYIFVNNYMRLKETQAFENVQFELEDGKLVPATPITVKKDVSFIMPAGITYGKLKAEYVTAQPLCKIGNTFFFVEIEGVKPIYKLEGKEEIAATLGKDNGFTVDGHTFVTLTLDEAKHITQSGDKLYIGDNCDILVDGDKIFAAQISDFTYFEFANGKFEERNGKGKKFVPATVTYKETRECNVDPKYLYYFHKKHASPDGRRKLHFYDINIEGGSGDGYLNIRYSGDSAQLYVDGTLYEDSMYIGADWMLPMCDLVGKKLKLIIAEYTAGEFYVEVEPKSNISIDSLTVVEK